MSLADLMFVTVPDGFEAGRIVELARTLNWKPSRFMRARTRTCGKSNICGHLALT